MTSKRPTVFVFCALSCEAKPLIDTWKLTKQTDSRAFQCYGDDDKVVVVSGIGKTAMAGAIGYAMARHPATALPIMLNFGIAGHPFLPCGSRVLAEKLIDSENNRCFYPKFAFDLPCATRRLISYPKAATQYQEDALYDMEASAFYELAMRFSSSELIHCLKLVSDNRQNSIEQIDHNRVTEWVKDALPSLTLLLQRLQQLRRSQAVVDCEQYRHIFREFHFSATNSVKVKSLLQRWQVLKGEDNQPLAWRNSQASNGKEFLSWLERQLDEIRFEL